jgi:hypothetical protein
LQRLELRSVQSILIDGARSFLHDIVEAEATKAGFDASEYQENVLSACIGAVAFQLLIGQAKVTRILRPNSELKWKRVHVVKTNSFA